MVLRNDYVARPPGGPRNPDSAAGGTPNHELLARLARLTWALEKGTATQQTAELEGIVQFYDNQIDNGFMTRGNANEQLSPSHSQWWLTAALGLRWLGWKLRDSRPDVSKPLLATKNGIGARAWPRDNKPYYGKCKLRDALYEAIEGGRVRKIWPPENLDMLGLIFADRLLLGGDDLGGAKHAPDLPKLRWPQLPPRGLRLLGLAHLDRWERRPGSPAARDLERRQGVVRVQRCSRGSVGRATGDRRRACGLTVVESGDAAGSWPATPRGSNG